MALVLINGISSVAAVTINSLVYDCMMGRWRGQATKQYFLQNTFCTSAGWRDEIAGIKAVDIISEGFLSHGVAASDPLADFGTAAGVLCVFQADQTLNMMMPSTITGTFHIESDFGVSALAPSEFAKRCRSKGPISSTWNTVS
jgi:hypothetical protein